MRVPKLSHLCVMCVLGCSGGEQDGSAAGGTNPSFDTGTEQQGDGSTSSVNGGHCTVDVSGESCVGETYVGESLPLDLYIMFDQSGSMLAKVDGGTRRIDAVRTAVGAFLEQPSSAGMGVGIGYFGYLPFGSTSCDPAQYEIPDRTIAELPGSAAGIVESLASREPIGETPTDAAIAGACRYAREHRRNHPGRQTALLFVTDGVPEAPVTCRGGSTCCPTLGAATAAASDCAAGDPPIKTYVMGVGPALGNLHEIAAAGHTEHAYLVGDENVATNVLTALNAIRAAASIPCQLQVPEPPPGQTLDYNLVNLVYSNASCETRTLYARDQASACDEDGGWYFERDGSGRALSIRLCEATCNEVGVVGSQLVFTMGCERKVQVE